MRKLANKAFPLMLVSYMRVSSDSDRHSTDHEISMLALHLIQNSMVYINTLMIQKVLAQSHWQGKMTPRDYAALTPLIWEHVNPYGRFDLDMKAIGVDLIQMAAGDTTACSTPTC